MSRLDGCAAAILLQKHPVLKKIPVIALIAAVSEISAGQIAAAGFTAHVVKPIIPDRLRHCVARLLRGGTWNLLQTILLHFVSQGVSADTELPSCLRLVSC